MKVSCNSYFHESLGGTESSLKKMESTGKPVRIIPFSGNQYGNQENQLIWRYSPDFIGF